MITTKKAAEKLGISQRRVQILLRKGRIKGTKIDRQWFIEELECTYERQRGGYRPRKTKANQS